MESILPPRYDDIVDERISTTQLVTLLVDSAIRLTFESAEYFLYVMEPCRTIVFISSRWDIFNVSIAFTFSFRLPDTCSTFQVRNNCAEGQNCVPVSRRISKWPVYCVTPRAS